MVRLVKIFKIRVDKLGRTRDKGESTKRKRSGRLLLVLR
jgi:hypothetical protein